MGRLVMVVACVACLALGLGALVFARLRDGGNQAAAPIGEPTAPLHVDDPAIAEDPGFVGVTFARQSVDVAASVEARLEDVRPRLGERVAKGALVATLDAASIRGQIAEASAAVQAAQADAAKAATELAQARDKRARLEKLENVVSAEELSTARYEERLAAARADNARAHVGEAAAHVDQLRTSLGQTQLLAPFDGVVAARYADPGAMLAAGAPIVRLISADDLWIRFAVPEAQAASITPHACVRASATSLPAPLDAMIETIAPEIDVATRMLVVEARLQLADGSRLPAGLPTRVTLAGQPDAAGHCTAARHD